MKSHTTLGAETLQEVQKAYPKNGFVRLGIEIARSHHERWDGTGYPHGLAGTAIPLSARIMAVADSYDAARSRRFYKPPLPHAECCARHLPPQRQLPRSRGGRGFPRLGGSLSAASPNRWTSDVNSEIHCALIAR